MLYVSTDHRKHIERHDMENKTYLYVLELIITFKVYKAIYFIVCEILSKSIKSVCHDPFTFNKDCKYKLFYMIVTYYQIKIQQGVFRYKYYSMVFTHTQNKSKVKQEMSIDTYAP